MMKKIFMSLVALVITLSMVACSNNTNEKKEESNTNDKEINESVKEDKPTQAEINAQIKNEATEANFVELNSDNDKDFIKKSVYVDGKVSNIIDDPVLPTLTLTATYDDGYGIFDIVVLDKENFKTLSDGDEIRVYGGYTGKSKLGFPQISGNVIEKLN